MFHFAYSGNFLEEYNKAPQSPNTEVSIYKKSALFNEGGKFIQHKVIIPSRHKLGMIQPSSSEYKHNNLVAINVIVHV